MKVCKPDFYKEFQCIGSRCKDTCCALWEIEVDEDSADRYARHEGPLKEDFRKYLVQKEDENYFRLTADKRCPFLNEENLCRMILVMGEDYICDICREHPRFYHWFGDYTEVGLGLCCEEAGRLLFERKEPLQFEVLSDEESEEEPLEQMDRISADGDEKWPDVGVETAEYEVCMPDNREGNTEYKECVSDAWEEIEEYDDYEEDWEETDAWVEFLLQARNNLISMLQNRGLSLGERMQKLLAFAEEMQPFLDEEDIEEAEVFLRKWTAVNLSLANGSECGETIADKRGCSAVSSNTGEADNGNCTLEKKLNLASVFSSEDTERLDSMLKFYEKLESLDQTWPEQMRRMQEELPEVLGCMPAYEKAVKEAGRETDYEHLLVYFIFRYFMETVFDSNILSPVRFAAVSLQMILLLDLENWHRTGTCSLEDRIRIAKWYSKEIEYCPDNMETLTCQLEEDRAWL